MHESFDVRKFLAINAVFWTKSSPRSDSVAKRSYRKYIGEFSLMSMLMVTIARYRVDESPAIASKIVCAISCSFIWSG